MLRNVAGLLLLSLAVVPAAANTPITANLTPLRQEAAKDPATLTRIEDASQEAGRKFDGFGTVQLLSPVGFVDLENSSFDGVVKETRSLEPAPVIEVVDTKEVSPPVREPVEPVATDDKTELADSYHFEGKPTKIPQLILYTAKPDAPGGNNSTEKPKTPWWQKILKPALLIGGIAATVAGIFFPPALFLGGFLLGAFATIKVLENMANSD
jgi:hypothetical protein